MAYKRLTVSSQEDSSGIIWEMIFYKVEFEEGEEEILRGNELVICCVYYLLLFFFSFLLFF